MTEDTDFVLDPAGDAGGGWTDLRELVELYLRRAGWSADAPGPAGAMWRVGDSALAVANRITYDSIEWRSVVHAVATIERRPAAVVASTIQLQLTDVTRLRAANDLVIAGSIPLPAGVSLVNSAFAMFRAAATASVRPRAHIAGNFSRIADEIARRTRLGHTQSGSYVIPVLMPLTPPREDLPSEPSMPGMEIERTTIEPAERRVTRTLAQALAALDQVVVQPARTPKMRDLQPAVVAGVTRELVTALTKVIADPAVAQLDATFNWASAVGAPGGLPARITIPDDAAPLLNTVAQLLKRSSYSPDEIVTGPIVEVRHEPDDPYGHVSVQTVRRGRLSEVRVRLTRDQLNESLDWMREARPVLVEGRIRRGVGQPLTIDEPRQVHPLDESYLPASG